MPEMASPQNTITKPTWQTSTQKQQNLLNHFQLEQVHFQKKTSGYKKTPTKNGKKQN